MERLTTRDLYIIKKDNKYIVDNNLPINLLLDMTIDIGREVEWVEDLERAKKFTYKQAKQYVTKKKLNAKVVKYITENIKIKYDYLISQGYEVVGIFLQGSQNYEVDVYDDEYKSDIDTKAIVLPTFSDLVRNKQAVSTTLEMDNTEHIDVKDIRLMFDNFKKQNTNYIEILFTKYYYINPKYKRAFKKIYEIRNDIAYYDEQKALNCIYGMAMQKFVALKHPYPTIKAKIDKYGYDPKQLHHILRLHDLILKYLQHIQYDKLLIPECKLHLIDTKKGIYSLEEAEALAKRTVDDIFRLKDFKVEKENKLKQLEVDSALYDIIEQCCKINFKKSM